MACNSCHKVPTANFDKVRTGAAAFPDVTDYPQHPSCIGCHRQQFFTGAQPVICTVCHTNPSPRDSSRHPFPNPPEIFNASKEGQSAISEFGISFPHDKHVDIVGEYKPNNNAFIPVSFRQDKAAKSEPKAEETDPKSCGVCHKTYQPQGDSDDEYVTKPPKDLAEDAFWLKKGAFKTAPTHVVCFTCHAPDGLQPTSSDCATCHKLLPPDRQIQLTRAHDDFDPKLASAMGLKDKVTLEKWSRRDTAKFRHEWIPHASLSCVSCHNVATLNTLDPKTRTQAKSCGGTGTGCHIEATTDGILNLEFQKKKADPGFECTKCHVRNGKNPAPETHINAVAAATKK
jgi:nitrate/TMAO reductase-like tetraheme cytochrome c subunit